MVGIKKYHLII
jgi:hypothetical protein